MGKHQLHSQRERGGEAANGKREKRAQYGESLLVLKKRNPKGFEKTLREALSRRANWEKRSRPLPLAWTSRKKGKKKKKKKV